MFDVIIKGASVVDGTGAVGRIADVGIIGGRISAFGRIPEGAEARLSIDGHGKVLAPGFIDIHTHSDLHLLMQGLGESKLLQGVTTEVTGNCSFAPFPINRANRDLHIDHLARATARTEITWSDLTGYAEALETNGLGLNVAPLAGHGTLRVSTLGVEQRAPTEDELARMCYELEAAISQGAWGMSTGLTHVPSAYGQMPEIVALAKVLARADALYATHTRGRYGTEESIELGRLSGVRVEHSHMAINHPKRWGTAHEKLGALEQAREEGVDILCDVYPYIASSSALTQHLPDWVQAGGTEEMRARLADPTVRAEALKEMTKGWFTGGDIPFLWDRFLIASTPDGYGVGKTIEELSEESGRDPYELTLGLCEAYGNEIRVVIFYRDERDVEEFVSHPLSVIGSDGNAVPMDQGTARIHPRSFGTFPRVLGRYVRERNVVTLEEAIRKMSAEPARRLGLKDRGVIREGNAADLVVFDPGTVIDTADFTSAPSAPVGIDMVMVNGVIMVDEGELNRIDRPGRVLLRNA